jgi:hypothetical protein
MYLLKKNTNKQLVAYPEIDDTSSACMLIAGIENGTLN